VRFRVKVRVGVRRLGVLLRCVEAQVLEEEELAWSEFGGRGRDRLAIALAHARHRLA